MNVSVIQITDKAKTNYRYLRVDADGTMSLTTDLFSSTVFRTDLDVDEGDKVTYFLEKARHTYIDSLVRVVGVSKDIFVNIDDMRISYTLTAEDYHSLY